MAFLTQGVVDGGNSIHHLGGRGKMTGSRVLPIFIAVSLTGCGGGGGGSGAQSSPSTTPPSSEPDPPPTARQFVDVTLASGIYVTMDEINSSGPNTVPVILENAATGGVAAGDYDGDGDIDLFITRGYFLPNLLYRNDGNLTFTDHATEAHLAWTKSEGENYLHSNPTFGDIDGDGDLDLFLGGLYGDPSLLFENNGDGTFSDITVGSGIDTLGAWSNLSAAFGDYDLDGDLDLLIAHWGTPRNSASPGDTETLWRNDTDVDGILFTSVSEPAGISPTIITLPDPNSQPLEYDYTWSLNLARINDDAYPDIVIAADFNKSQVFMNNQDGTFANATDVGVIVDENGMGSALGDYDNDGDLDWFVTSIFALADAPGKLPKIGNRLYRNDNGSFVDVTTEASVADGGWGWGTCFMDFENDGDLDIYHTNGWPLRDGETDYSADRSRAFVADGTGVFEENAAELGLDDFQDGRGVVCADFDEDGDVDILQLHRGVPYAATLWRNDTSGNNFLRVSLNGLPPNTEASGARITVTIGATQQMRDIILGSNFVSQNPAVQVFGLGSFSQVDEVRVEWPGVAGLQTSLLDVAANQTLSIDHPGL